MSLSIWTLLPVIKRNGSEFGCKLKSPLSIIGIELWPLCAIRSNSASNTWTCAKRTSVRLGLNSKCVVATTNWTSWFDWRANRATMATLQRFKIWKWEEYVLNKAVGGKFNFHSHELRAENSPPNGFQSTEIWLDWRKLHSHQFDFRFVFYTKLHWNLMRLICRRSRINDLVRPLVSTECPVRLEWFQWKFDLVGEANSKQKHRIRRRASYVSEDEFATVCCTTWPWTIRQQLLPSRPATKPICVCDSSRPAMRNDFDELLRWVTASWGDDMFVSGTIDTWTVQKWRATLSRWHGNSLPAVIW